MLGEYTLREIKEGAVAVEKTIAMAATLESIANKLVNFEKIYTIGCGSSYWAALILAELLRPAKIDVQTVVSSEMFFYEYPENEKTLIITFSQSGETSETLKALEQAKACGAATLAILNQEHSHIEAIADYAFVTPAGNEQMVATKSFDAAIAAAYILAKSLTGQDYSAIKDVPNYYEDILSLDLSPALAIITSGDHVFTIGTGRDYAVAGETALKLEESARMAAIALPIMEISHGPKISTEGAPVIMLATQEKFKPLYDNILAEITAVGAKPVIYAPPEAEFKNGLSLPLPVAGELSLFASIKLSQRLAIETAVQKGLDPDNPPALTKFVKRDDLDII